MNKLAYNLFEVNVDFAKEEGVWLEYVTLIMYQIK